MSDRIDDLRVGDKSLSAYVHRVTSAIGAQMSPTGRRAATSVAASKGRQWVNRTLGERPTRGELRAWFGMVLDERRDLHNRVEALTKENEALRAQRDDALEDERTAREASTIYWEEAEGARRERDAARTELAERSSNSVGLDSAVRVSDALDRTRAELDAVRAQRDEALEGYREDVERFRAHVETLDADRTRRTRERDTAERNLHERTVEMTRAYEELRVAYEQAEAERNELAKRAAARDIVATMKRTAEPRRLADDEPGFVGNGLGAEEIKGRVECSHGVGVNFTTLRLSPPDGGAE